MRLILKRAYKTPQTQQLESIPLSLSRATYEEKGYLLRDNQCFQLVRNPRLDALWARPDAPDSIPVLAELFYDPLRQLTWATLIVRG